MLQLDHLAFSCERLADGVAALETALGVPLAPGGVHPLMGTHNRLLSLGPDEYLELIAVDPSASPPPMPRWFDLDRFTGPVRLTHWICRTDDLAGSLACGPAGLGQATDLARGDFRWRFGIPPQGRLPFDDTHPALIEWQGDAHPCAFLPDQGCRLHALHVTHPDAVGLRQALGVQFSDDRVHFHTGPAKMLLAEIATTSGLKVI